MAFEAVVTDIKLASRDGLQTIWWMSLDRTHFATGDRGMLEAVTRTGTRLTIPVTGVVEDGEGVVWHVVEKPLAAGTEVVGSTDSDILKQVRRAAE